MKTSDLIGAELDYWVAKAEGLTVPMPGWASRMSDGVRIDSYFRPSSDWAHGGPIIERERIEIEFSHVQGDDDPWFAVLHDIFFHSPSLQKCEGKGPTVLIAAMRAYVTSKFGEEVVDNP